MDNNELPKFNIPEINSEHLKQILKSTNIQSYMPNIQIPKLPEFKNTVPEKFDELINVSKDTNNAVKNIDTNIKDIINRMDMLINTSMMQSKLSEEYQKEILDQLEQIRINTDEKDIYSKLVDEFKKDIMTKGIEFALIFLLNGLKSLIFKL